MYPLGDAERFSAGDELSGDGQALLTQTNYDERSVFMKLSKLVLAAAALTACSAVMAFPKVTPPTAEQQKVFDNYVSSFKNGTMCYKGVAAAQFSYAFLSDLSTTGWANLVTTEAYKQQGDDLLYRGVLDATTKASYLKKIGLTEEQFIDFLKSVAAVDAYKSSLQAVGYDAASGYMALFDEQYAKCSTHFKVKPLDEEAHFNIMEGVSANAHGQDMGWDEFNPLLAPEKKAMDYDGAFRMFGAR